MSKVERSIRLEKRFGKALLHDLPHHERKLLEREVCE